MMPSNTAQTQSITVMPVGMDTRKLSVFRMAFRMHHSHQHYQLLDEAPGLNPDLAIVDVDSITGWNAWHDFRAEHPHLPALIVTTTPPSDAPAAVLRKPIRIETLFPQMRELLRQPPQTSPLRTMLEQTPAQRPAHAAAHPARTTNQADTSSHATVSDAAAYVASVAPTLDAVISQSQAAHRAEAAARQQESHKVAASDLPQLMDLPDDSTAADSAAEQQDTAQANSHDDVVRSMLPPSSTNHTSPTQPAAHAETHIINYARFDPHAGLFGLVARLLRQRSNAVVRVREVPVLIVQAAQDKAWLLQPLDSLQALCAHSSQEVDHQAWNDGSAPAKGEEIRPQTLAWQLAIWTCQGRLMRGISADTPIRLRYWPNLTRLAPIPEAMRITAFLTRTPVNLKLITRLLKVPPEHLFNYLAAAYGIGILDLPNRNTTLQVMSTEPVRPPPRKEAAAAVSATDTAPASIQTAPGSGSLLSRLLKKVIGL
ncbi:hypothetical protein [Aquitalea sp. LB_tupeE]|uniref:hypothetical protein n=1 Tax=Aquitalea sp. LB_tupeE TaxID=2748078 RepID=UPI0015C0E9DD|nr:hypothetical protein [Aquitalea sp. LB_tupeE]NWK78990.1 hypothetical protein [Aquitalea sp. LB_tupeE]